MKKLAVVVAFFNPFDNDLTRKNLITTVKSLYQAWPDIFVVEVKYKHHNKKGNAKYTPKEVKHIYLEAESVFFHKERMNNIVCRELAEDYEVVAAFDADILFPDRFWPQRIITTLEEFDLAQCFMESASVFKDDRGDKIRDIVNKSCMYMFLKQGLLSGSPGGAWAGRKKFWDIGQFDSYVLGSNDSILFDGITGRARGQVPVQYKKVPTSRPMHDRIIEYTDRMEVIKPIFVRQNVEFQFHTTLTAKRYGARHTIMVDFNPDKELEVNKDGLYEWKNPNSNRARLMTEYFEVKDNPEKDWSTAVDCLCINSTPTDAGFIKAGQVIRLPMQQINNHFRIIWDE